MPVRLRPTAPLAGEAILVGDPGRALLLAQELLVEPKMSNHARGLWGYSGATEAGRALTIQSTGMGGPSAALVLTDLVELGLQRAVRVGTCVALDSSSDLGTLLVVDSALAVGASATAHGALAEEAIRPSAELTARLAEAPGIETAPVAIASFDVHPPAEPVVDDGLAAADMQTAPLLAQARRLDVELAALLIVAETSAGEQIAKELLERRERLAGQAAATVL